MGTRNEILPISLNDKIFFEEFYEEYKNFMFYSARKYVSNQSECEDIVQDTLERLLRNISTIREISGCRLRKYIVLTVRAAYLDGKKRKRGVFPVYFNDVTIEALVNEDLIAPKDWYDFSTYLDVERLKRELPMRDWIVLEGKYIMGYSQSELGQLIGVSPDSVRMIICRAKEKLGRYFIANNSWRREEIMNEIQKQQLIDEYDEAMMKLFMRKYEETVGSLVWNEYQTALLNNELAEMPTTLDIRCKQIMLASLVSNSSE